MITSKSEFASLSRAIHQHLLQGGHTIKLGRLRETLANALRRNSCADLLTHLPVQIPCDFSSKFARLLFDRHRIAWTLPAWRVPWPIGMVLEHNEFLSILNDARASIGLEPVYITDVICPDGQGGWLVPDASPQASRLEEFRTVFGSVHLVPFSPYDSSLNSDAYCRAIAESIKPLAFAYWDDWCEDYPRGILAEFADSPLATADGASFTLDNYLGLSMCDLEDLGIQSVGRNPLQANMIPNPLMPWTYDVKKCGIKLKGAVKGKLVSMLCGQCLNNELMPEALSKQKFDYQRDLWSLLRHLHSSPLYVDLLSHDQRFKHYNDLFWKDARFKRALSEFAYEWLDNHADWRKPIRTLLNLGVKQSVEDTGYSKLFRGNCTPKVDSVQLGNGLLLDFSVGYYRADAYPYYDCYEDDYRNAGLISGKESEEDEEELFGEGPSLWDTPCVFPFKIAYGSGYLRATAGGPPIGHIAFDFLGTSGDLLGGPFHTSMDVMSAKFYRVANFYRDKGEYPDWELHDGVVILNVMERTDSTSFEQLADALDYMIGEFQPTVDESYQVVISPDILRYQFASMYLVAVPSLREKLIEEQHQLVNALCKNAVNADWLRDEREVN